MCRVQPVNNLDGGAIPGSVEVFMLQFRSPLSLVLAGCRRTGERSAPVANVKPRSAFTLIELLLVISIVVIVAALAIPAVHRTIDSQSLTKSGDRLRVAMGKARVSAIRKGEVHALFYVAGGGWFDVGAMSKFQEMQTRSAQRIRYLQQHPSNYIQDDALPRGIRFAAGEVGHDSRSAEAMQTANASDEMKMVLFYPDGTAQDARIVLQNEYGELVAVELRGLTGLAKSLMLETVDGR